MISVPKRFAGFSTAQAVLNDPSLSADQKKTALLTWRATLTQAALLTTEDRSDTDKMIRDIDAALATLDRPKRS